MSAEHPASSVLSCNLESPIYTDFLRHDEKEKLLDQSEDRSSGDENEELDPEPPPVAVRRKVSFADAFGLNLVSVKEFDNRDSSGSDNLMGLLGPEGEEFYLSCLFTIPASDRDLMVRLQQQKMDLESIELLPGTTTVRGIIRVLNLCFHKAVYVRTSLDGWQSYFDLLAEYVPGSSDGETDRFSFQLMLTPPFQAEGARVEFCLRYESSVGTFWANNGNMNYTVFCHQRRRSDLKEKEREREKEGLADESNQKGIRSCLKTISKKICPDTPTEASGDNSEYVRLRAGRTREKATAEERDITSPKSLRDCCKTLVDRRRKRRAARLARVQDYISLKDMEIYKDLQVPKLSIPGGSEMTTIRAGKMQSMETPPILMYHQIPLLSLDWGNNTTAPVHAKPTDVFSETDPESHQAEDRSAKSTNDVRKTFISADSTHTHDSTQDQECHLAEPVFNDSAQSQSNLEVIGPGDSGVVELMERTLLDVHEGADKDQDYVDWKALDILESDPREQSNDLSTGHSREPVPDYQHAEEPENTLMTCAVQESEPKGEGKESEGPGDRRTPQYENTSRPLSEDLARSLESPGDMGQATRDGESQNSKAGDRISPEECTSSFDTSNAEAKVKENINQAVNETLTFKGIREEPFRDRQTAGSTERRDTDKDGELDTANKNVGEKKGSEEQVKIRARREEPEEEVRKDEKTLSTRDQSPEIQSVSLCESAAFNESKLCTPNKNLNRDNSDLQRDEERCFEPVKEGLKMKKRLSERTAEAAIDDAGDDYEVYSETSRENEEESRVGDDYTDGEEIGGDDAFIESLERKETSHQLHATAHACINAPTHRRDPSSLQDRDATSADEDFELGKTLRNRAAQDSQELDGEDERPTPLPSVHLSWAGGPGCGRLLSWWGQFCALGHVTQALVCAVLFVIFVTVYLYDLPTCLGLYLFSVLWWCGQGVKQRLDGAISVD